jgi:hypothetical protein
MKSAAFAALSFWPAIEQAAFVDKACRLALRFDVT